MKLQTCDIILWINEKNDPVNKLSRWAIGPYSHVAMYLGKFFNVPFVFESRGRGAIVASLVPQTGMPVAIMRPKALEPGLPQSLIDWTIKSLLDTAFEMAADEMSFYDYFAIVHSVLPRVLIQKLHLPLPHIYRRDIFVICSEAVAEVWWRNKTVIVPKDPIPLPGDFASSEILQYIGQGKLMEDIVP